MNLIKSCHWALLLAIFVISSSMQAGGPGKELRQAAYAGDLDEVTRLLEEGVNPDSPGKKGGTPLIKAAKSGRVEIVQLLLFHGADPHQSNNKGSSAIDVAYRNEETEIVSIMTEAGHEQAVTIGVKPMSHDEFIKAMGAALQGRRWVIEKTEQFKITARYKRSKRAYKVEASLHDNRIIIRFIKGYGAKRTNYLNNLKKDLKQRL